MNLLLDTHIFIWWNTAPDLLSQQAYLAVEDTNNRIYVSTAVIWEIVIKTSFGRMESFGDPLAMLYAEQFIPLPITPEHAIALKQVENIHNDPFDRIQIAQAKS